VSFFADDMSNSYPRDSDGDALRNVVESGADLSRPMVIDFSVKVRDEPTARRVAGVVAANGYDPSISEDDGGRSWSIYCSKSMLATYEGIVAVKAELNELVKPHGGSCDGWATFGNNQQ
jgi:hypothetical protein